MAGGVPSASCSLPGQANDAANALALLDGLEAAHVIADRAYDTHAILDHVEAIGATPIIPQRSCMTRKRAFDPAIQTQEQDRADHRQAQAVPPHRHALRPAARKLSSQPPHRFNRILVLNVEPA